MLILQNFVFSAAKKSAKEMATKNKNYSGDDSKKRI
jgi:hypothetical protein